MSKKQKPTLKEAVNKFVSSQKSIRKRPRFSEADENNKIASIVIDRSVTLPSPLLETDNTLGATCGKIEGGEINVTFDGAATYNLPLWVPPGRLGIQANLSLQYHSRAGNGLCGMGWDLGGLSEIRIGKKSFSNDGHIEAVKFDQTDPYYLDGQRLILIGGQPGAEGAEYRVKKIIFQRL
jgi:hypothetical protein